MAAQDKPEVADSIDSARVSMRALAPADAALFCDLFTDPQTMQFIGPPLSRQRAMRSFHKILDSMQREPPERLLLTVLDRATGTTIGIGSIQSFDAARRCAEAGIMLKTGARAHGLAIEAFATLVAHAFARFALDEVRARIAADHAVAERVLIGVGFRRNDTRSAADYNDRSDDRTRDDRTRNERLTRSWSIHRDSRPAPGFMRAVSVDH